MTVQTRPVYAGRRMSDSIDLLRERRLAAIVQAPQRAALIARAEAAARGGITLLALPVSIPHVAEIAHEIADRTDATVGLCDVIESEHLTLALAAGAEFVISPVFDNELIRVGPAGLDLGRTLQRWSMSAARQREFLAAYRAAAPCDPGPLGFWLLVSALWSARVRLDQPPERQAAALGAVRRFAADPTAIHSTP